MVIRQPLGTVGIPVGGGAIADYQLKNLWTYMNGKPLTLRGYRCEMQTAIKCTAGSGSALVDDDLPLLITNVIHRRNSSVPEENVSGYSMRMEEYKNNFGRSRHIPIAASVPAAVGTHATSWTFLITLDRPSNVDPLSTCWATGAFISGSGTLGFTFGSPSQVWDTDKSLDPAGTNQITVYAELEVVDEIQLGVDRRLINIDDSSTSGATIIIPTDYAYPSIMLACEKLGGGDLNAPTFITSLGDGAGSRPYDFPVESAFLYRQNWLTRNILDAADSSPNAYLKGQLLPVFDCGEKLTKSLRLQQDLKLTIGTSSPLAKNPRYLVEKVIPRTQAETIAIMSFYKLDQKGGATAYANPAKGKVASDRADLIPQRLVVGKGHDSPARKARNPVRVAKPPIGSGQ